MTVTERVMGIGQWGLTLSPDTPRYILDLLDIERYALGHIAITKTHVDSLAFSDATMLSLCRYTGVFRGRDEFALEGCGLAMWLADEDGKGDIPETPIVLTAATLSTAVTAVKPAALSAGTVTNPAGTISNSYVLASRRDILDAVVDSFGAEWRINPDFTLDAATAAVLYPATPTTVIVRNEGDSGREPNITGVQGAVNIHRDVEDYTTKVILTTQSSAGVASTATASSGATTYKDPQGNSVTLKRIVSGTNVDTASAASLAAAQLGRFSSPRRQLTLSAESYDIAGDVKVGSPVYVWDPLQRLMDAANEVKYRGQTIQPMISRVLGYTWPIQNGMGVYFRWKTGGTVTWTDLTPYIEWEDGATQVEVGATPRTSGASGTGGGTLNIIPTARATWTPSFAAGITLGNGVLVGEYTVAGGMCHWSIQLTLGTTSAVTGLTSLNLPLPRAHTIAGFSAVGRATIAGTGYPLVGIFSATSDICVIRAVLASGTYAAHAELAAAVPAAWASTSVLAMSGSYPI